MTHIKKKQKTFCGFSMGRNQYWAGRVYDLCVYYMTGTPEGSTESGFMEKPGIEPATPGLQGIALIHYTTGASLTRIIGPKGHRPFLLDYIALMNQISVKSQLKVTQSAFFLVS